MNRKMARLMMLLGAMILPGLVEPAPPLRQDAPAQIGRKIPFNRIVLTRCADRRIRLTGEFQLQFSVTRDAGGDSFIQGDFNAEGVAGVGLRSGNKYQANGTGHFDSRGASPIQFTYVFNFALNKSGATDSLMGHVKFRISADADGKVTVVILDVDIDCNK